MKRTLFFWIDRLKIRRNERVVLTICMTCTLILSGILFWIDFTPNGELYDYSEIEEVFFQRSEQQTEEHNRIMARYTGIQISVDEVVALPEEKSVNVKTYEIAEPEHLSADTTRININTADAEKLQQLPGIGPAYATRIVEWRQENGVFQSIEQLLEIRGIGPARLENIRPFVEL